MTILPTGTCFDDALDFISERVKREPRLALTGDLILVHGICLAPEGRRAGEPFSHAWVEDSTTEVNPPLEIVWQGGVLDGQRIWYAMPRAEFESKLRPQKSTRYTMREAALENKRTNHFGPWVEEYSNLCKRTGEADVFWPEPNLMEAES